VFISGGLDCYQKAIKNFYTFNISNNALERKEDMNEPRAFHGLSKMAQRIFAFGTCGDMDDPMPSAEVYDVVKNSWKKLPDMPKAGSWITCVRV